MIEAREIDGELWIKAADHHKAVQVAIEHEREACLNLADSLGWVNVDHIRARGQA